MRNVPNITVLNSSPQRFRFAFAAKLVLLLLLLMPPVMVCALSYTNSYGIWSYTANGGGITITGYSGSVGTVTIPNTIPNFNNWPVVSIGQLAFQGTSLTSVTISSNVTSIGEGAFAGLTSLNAINVDTNNIVYGSMDGVLFGYESVGTIMYDKYQLVLIQYPGGRAGSYTISNIVTSIGDYAFEDCFSLTNVTIPNSVTNIGDEAFQNCSGLASINIPNSITNIGDEAFSLSGLTSVIIPNSITSIGYGMFYGTSLTSVTIPNSVTSIGDYAFLDCLNLTSVFFTSNAPAVDSTVFSGDNNATAYYLPETTGWSTFDEDSGLGPAVLWNPQVQTGDSSFGVQMNQFGFNITGSSNLVVVVEACTNLANPVWLPVSTSTLIGGTNYFSDPQWTNYPSRFYRISSP